MDIQTAIEKAREAAQKGQISLAQKILSAVLQKAPNSVDAWLLMADIIEDQNRAIQCLERVLKLAPEHPLAVKKLAELSQPADDPFANLYLDGQTEPAAPAGESFQSDFGAEPQPVSPFYDDTAVPEPFGQPLHSEVADPFGEGIAAAPAVVQKPVQRKNKKKPPAKKSSRILEIGLIIVIVMCLCVVLAIAIGQSDALSFLETGPTPTVENPLVVIYENLDAANAEDLDRYMETIHPRAPGRSMTRSMLDEIAGNYNLHYSVQGVKILSQTDTEARVSMILTTQKISGPAFRDNRISVVMILRLSEGRWKIYDQEVLETQYLD